MATAFTLTGSLKYPPDDGQPVAERPFSQSGQFDSKQESDLMLVGAGTHIVDFGTVATAKALLIEVAPTSLAPINLNFNGGSDDVEIAPGGFLAFSSPVPSTGITDVSIDYTMDARVQIRVLG